MVNGGDDQVSGYSVTNLQVCETYFFVLQTREQLHLLSMKTLHSEKD